jgi:site-specific DNA recombinase
LEWNALQERKTGLQTKLESADEPPPLLHLGMAELYRQKVTDLAAALEHPETRTEAAESIRGLIEAIVLTPAAGALEARVVRRGQPARARVPAEAGHYDGASDSGLQIELRGNLAAMLSAAQNATRSPETGDLELQIAMVAGARNRRYLQISFASIPPAGYSAA